MGSALLAIFILAPFLIYIRAAFSTPKETLDPDTFFLAPGRISSTEFANTSVAYGFQIASVSVFIAWGYFYGLGAFVNPVFWGVGILLFALALRRVVPFLGTRQTLHGFLGQRYRSRTLTVLASLMTLVGFLGAFTAELVWGSYVFSLINPDPIFIYCVTTAMGLFVVFYLCRCGCLSVIRTDQYQLIFAHTGFLSAAVAIITLLHWKGPSAAAIGLLLSGALSLILLVIFAAIRRQRKLEIASNAGSPESREAGLRAASAGPAVFLQFIVFAALAATVVNFLVFLPAVRTLPEIAGDRNLYDFSQGSLNLLSLALLPLCWQFFDVTNWQRIGAVRVSRDASGEPDLRPIRTGLLRTAFESPASWIFAVLLGVGIRYTDIGLDADSIWMAIGEFPQLLAGGTTPFGPYFGTVLAVVFAAGVVAVMLSTADSLLMGSTFTLVYDLIPAATKTTSGEFLKQHPKRAIRIGKIAALLSIIVGLASYWVCALFDFDLLSLLFGAFSAQIALFPAVAGTLFLGNRAPGAKWAIASVCCGFFGGMITVAIALGNPAWQLYPPLASLGLSALIMAIGCLVLPRAPEVNNGGVP